MNEPNRKLQHRAREQEAEAAQAGSQSEAHLREFASVDELIRHDAAHTEVPASVTERLRKSSVGTSLPRKPWWQRLLGP